MLLTRDGIGLWRGSGGGMQPPCLPAGPRRPGLILDRDGTLVVEVDHLSRAEEVRLETGAAALLRQARARGWGVGVATNQSGIDRGRFGWPQFAAVMAEIDRRLAAEGTGVELAAACPFHPDYPGGGGAAESWWRKPGPGLVHLLVAALNLDRQRTWMVGDAARDIAAARAAGLAGAIHVLTGHGARDRAAALALASPGFPVQAAADAAGALAVLPGDDP